MVSAASSPITSLKSSVTVTLVIMVPAVSTMVAHPTLVLMAAGAMRSMGPILASVHLVTMAIPVNTHAKLVTMVTNAVNSASALVMALVI